MEIKELLPGAEHLRLESMMIEGDKLMLTIVSIQLEIICPYCHHQAQRRHSAYQRKVADLAWADRMAYLYLEVRHFFCDNPACEKKTFSERLPEIVAPYKRRTVRLADKQRKAGLESGGAGGARMLSDLMMPLSGATVLQLIRAGAPEIPVETPRVVGVDDWAWCKGQRYGTILVDLENHQVVDLLADCSAESVAHWLQAHPGVEIISRDRGQVFIEGATIGAPEAIQVADRWHLLKNLGEHLKGLLEKYVACLYAAPEPAALPEANQTPLNDQPVRNQAEKSAPKPLSQAEQVRQASRDRRLARYEAVIKLHQEGVSHPMCWPPWNCLGVMAKSKVRLIG